MAASTASVVDVQSLAGLISALEERGYQVVGPQVRDGAVVLDRLSGVMDLPAGWTDTQAPGQYRLARNGGGALFACHTGPQSWKKFLHPADIRLFRTDPVPRYAFFGVKPCELAAIRIQDRVLMDDRYPDVVYQARRRGAFMVAVNCTSAAGDCFCASMGTGPSATGPFDLVLTELCQDGRHEFLVEAGSAAGEEILAALAAAPAGDDVRSRAAAAVAEAAIQIRTVDTAAARQALNDGFDHPRWDDVAARCMCCGNCTMACPTCFCTTVEDVSAIGGANPERLRKWDSCFTLAFSYIHGGSVRSSAKSRYRQWLTHKFASWVDQFGSSGCVGCGRCITWCPAGIDITQELEAIQRPASRQPSAMELDDDGDA
jgi:formate hydrogenlyase subunit 6/NADH:ubiquinone oxidoreductase subunit I